MPVQEIKLTTIGRLYAWSVVFEPLLFFVVAHSALTGVGANLARILQIFVLIGLALRWLLQKKPFLIFNPASPLYVEYTYYYIFAIFAGLLGLISGSYVLDMQYNPDYASSLLASIIRGPSFRPVFEYFIALYYFAYFVVLPRYLLNSTEGVQYFFKIFSITFGLFMILGGLDLVLVIFGHELIHRHLSDGVEIGFRFHSLAGEPRDAFVYLMFGMATLTLREFLRDGKSISKAWIITILAAALLTQSASGLFGLLFSGFLMLAFSLKHPSKLRTLVSAGLFLMVSVGTIYVCVYFSQRLQFYVDALYGIFRILDQGEPIPQGLLGQMNNIFPIWDMYQKIIHGNVLPLIFGSGLGSSSIINNNLGYWNDLTNPHAQLVRVLYESGVVGLYFLVMSFVYPVRILTVHLPPKVAKRFLLFTLVLVGAFLAHRSATPFIYLGIFMLVMQRSRAPSGQQEPPVGHER
ncbi:MAG: hypothetical protein ACOY4M_09395 [Pseudomonadota bacterium]